MVLTIYIKHLVNDVEIKLLHKYSSTQSDSKRRIDRDIEKLN